MYSCLALTAVPLVSPQNLRVSPFRDLDFGVYVGETPRPCAGKPGLKSVFFLESSQLSGISSDCSGSRVFLDEHLRLAGGIVA